MFRDRSRTRPIGLFVLAALVGGPALTGPAQAQQQQGPPAAMPRLFVVTPNGGKAGSTVEVTLTGLDIEEPTALLTSHPGLKAELIVPPPPPPPADPKKPVPPPPPGPPKFKVTIAPDAPLGLHDIRFIGKYGISNPRAFAVGDQAEAAEKEPNNDVEQAQRVDLNTTVTGAIAQPTDVDYFVFTGKKGQRVVISCLSSSLDSRLEPVIEIYDASGRQLALNRNYSGDDALADVTCASDGDYFVRLYQFTHVVGGPEYFYRLTITTAPWIDAVYPPVVEPGKPAQVTLYGRNLPGGQLDPTAVVDSRVLEKATVTITPPTDAAALQKLNYSGYLAPVVSGMDGFEYRVKNAAGASNPKLIGLARAPVVLDGDTNDKPDTAQELKVPCEVAGRIEKRRDRDWFKFSAKMGEVYGIEIFSERIGSGSDMQLVIRTQANKQIVAELDDSAETLHPFKFLTRTSDPQRFRLQVPADGDYELFVTSQDADTQAGPRSQYRLSILPERPDFRVVLMPEDAKNPNTCLVEQGGTQMFDVFVVPIDGWAGEIQLTLEGLPPGVTCPPVTVGPGVRNAALVVTAAANAAPWAGPIRVVGTATVNGQKIVREARSASIVWPVNPQQNTVTISRLDRNPVLAVRTNPAFTLTLTQDKATTAQGDKVTIAFKLNRLWPDFKTPLQVNALGLGAGLTFNNAQNQPITLAPGNDNGSAVFTVAANVLPGTYSVVLRGQAQIPYAKDAMAKQKANVNVVQASAPITITVLPKALATVTLANANPTLQVGKEVEVVVKVARQFNYAGEFKVELVLPPGVTGVTADPVTIPAGKDEAKLILKAPASSAPGNRQNLTAKATALYNSMPIVHEVKFNVNVTK